MKDNGNLYRHEFKYIISYPQLILLQNRISGIMAIDPHVRQNKKYNIRSVYFDDCYNTCYYENENGIDPREKLRIRIYNHSSDVISLECKRKQRGKTLKTSCSISKECAENLIKGAYTSTQDSDNKVLRKLILATQTKAMRPAVIVEYDRIPYVYKQGNVRVTFDTNICSSTAFCDFFEPTIKKRPIMPVNYHLLEVKFDEFIPDFIYDNLNLEQLQQTNFSKYYLSRKFSF